MSEAHKTHLEHEQTLETTVSARDIPTTPACTKRTVLPNLSTERVPSIETLRTATLSRLATLTPEERARVPERLAPGHEPRVTEAGTPVKYLPRSLRRAYLAALGAYFSQLVRPRTPVGSTETDMTASTGCCVEVLDEVDAYVFHAAVENNLVAVHEIRRAAIRVKLLKAFLRDQRPIFRHQTALFGRTPEKRKALLDILEAQKLHGDETVEFSVKLEKKVRAPRTTSELRGNLRYHRSLLATYDLELELCLGRKPRGKSERAAFELMDALTTAKPKSEKDYVASASKKAAQANTGESSEVPANAAPSFEEDSEK